MRKRKSPIALVTALVIIVCGVAGLQFVNSQGASPADQPPAPPVENTKSVGEARPAETPSSIKAGITQAMGPKPGSEPSKMEQMARMGGRGGGSMILNPAASTAKPEKPKPSSSSTSTQWYNNESALASDKG